MASLKKKILIIDDDPQVLEIITTYLEKVDFDTLSISDPMQVEKIIQQQYIDAVICDFTMPKRSGGDVLRLIRAHESRKIPIIIISGKDKSLAKDSTFADGTMNFFMEKPIDFPLMIRLINKYLRRFQLINPEDLDQMEVLAHMTLPDGSSSFEATVLDYGPELLSFEVASGKAIRGEEYNISIRCADDKAPLDFSFLGRVDEINHFEDSEEVLITPINLDMKAVEQLAKNCEGKQDFIANFLDMAKGSN